MKLYSFDPAANAQRVKVFLAEKQMNLPIVEVNVREGAQFEEPFASMNPFNCVPFLELDDGTVIAESVSICRYLEEVHPEPSMFGRTPEERAVIDMWVRRVELDAFLPMLHAVRNHLPMFEGRVLPGTRSELPQLTELVQRGQDAMAVFLDRIEPCMGRREFLAGGALSIADITGFFTIRMTKAVEMDTSRWPNVMAWFARLAARPAFDV
ncbi:MAG: glutathione S-transferase family protein [Pseudomonadota bacterium]